MFVGEVLIKRSVQKYVHDFQFFPNELFIFLLINPKIIYDN